MEIITYRFQKELLLDHCFDIYKENGLQEERYINIVLFLKVDKCGMDNHKCLTTTSSLYSQYETV
jgi:hypothetical protein